MLRRDLRGGAARGRRGRLETFQAVPELRAEVVGRGAREAKTGGARRGDISYRYLDIPRRFREGRVPALLVGQRALPSFRIGHDVVDEEEGVVRLARLEVLPFA